MNHEQPINASEHHLPTERGRNSLTQYREPTVVDEDDDEIDLRELWLVIMRRKGTIIAITFLVFLVTLIVTLLMEPIYRASATIQIQPEMTKYAGVDVNVDGQAANTNIKDFYQTQYELLQSRNLARRVIDQLGLESELRNPSLNLEQSYLTQAWNDLWGMFIPSAPTEEVENQVFNFDNSDIARQLGERPIEDNFLASLSIAPVKNSQIVTIQYNHPNPEKAANIANALASNFINMNLERRQATASFAETFLKEELVKAKAELQEKERELVEFEQAQGIINTGGEKGDMTLTAQRLTQLSAELANAESERIKLQSRDEKASSADTAKQILTNSTIQELKKVLAQAETQYQAELASSSAYNTPIVRELRQQLNKIQSDFQAERAASSANDNTVVRGLKQELAKLQGELQAQWNAPQARDNEIVRTLLRQLAQLRSQYQAELSASTAHEDPTIRNLTNTLNNLNAQYQDQLKIYKPAYPSMQQLQQRINEVRSQIVTESQQIRNSKLGNLKQQIDTLQAQVNNEAKVDNASKVNYLKQRVAELSNQIQREVNTINNSTLANLQQRMVDLKSQIEREVSTSNNATLSNLKQRIEALKSQLALEAASIEQTVGGSIAADLAAAVLREEELKQEVNAQKTILADLNSKSVGYNAIRREVETSRNLYEALLQRIKEIGVASGVGSNNISTVDLAIIPFSQFKPNVKLNLALGMVLGLFLGVVIAFLLEFLDDRVKTTHDLERLLGLPLLGIAPQVKLASKDKKEQDIEMALMTKENPASATAEAFRSMRTNLLFSTSTGAPRSLTITSSMPAEAKSSTCTNLASAFAQAGKRILIIDADLRKPTLHKRLKLNNDIGFSHYLTHQANHKEVTQATALGENVHAITAGPHVLNPAELLSNERLTELFQLVPQQYDMLIFDAPPVMGLADALIISNQVDATILVAAHAQSKKRALVDAHQRLRQAQANLIGVVLTKMRSGASYGYDYYYNYYNYGGDGDDANTPKQIEQGNA